MLGAGLVVALTGCSPAARRSLGLDGPGDVSPGTTPSTATTSTTVATTSFSPSASLADTPKPVLDDIPLANPGTAHVLYGGPKGTRQVALTIDDGYCASCVAGYVEFAITSGIAITFNPNGRYRSLWTPSIVSSVREMIANGQVQIGNHTWSHANLLTLGSKGIASEITRNEEWINETFGITARPYFRPPYGFYNSRVKEVAGELGYTSILMWNGSFGDAALLTPRALIGQAEKWLDPGRIVLGHLNHPTVLSLFPEIEAIITRRRLDPVTLDAMFGTSRATG